MRAQSPPPSGISACINGFLGIFGPPPGQIPEYASANNQHFNFSININEYFTYMNLRRLDS